MLFVCPVGWAHPHVWVDTDLTLLVEGNSFTGLKVEWVFDPLYSASFVQEVDTNGNQQLEPAEVAAIRKATFETELAMLEPFFLLKFGKPNNGLRDNPYANVPEADFTAPQSRIWYDAANEALHYTFTLKFTEPQPMAGQHKVAVYDPSYYIAFEQHLDIQFSAPTGCTYLLEEDQSIRIYQGLVHPETYKLSCQPSPEGAS